MQISSSVYFWLPSCVTQKLNKKNRISSNSTAELAGHAQFFRYSPSLVDRHSNRLTGTRTALLPRASGLYYFSGFTMRLYVYQEQIFCGRMVRNTSLQPFSW